MGTAAIPGRTAPDPVRIVRPGTATAHDPAATARLAGPIARSLFSTVSAGIAAVDGGSGNAQAAEAQAAVAVGTGRGVIGGATVQPPNCPTVQLSNRPTAQPFKTSCRGPRVWLL